MNERATARFSAFEGPRRRIGDRGQQ